MSEGAPGIPHSRAPGRATSLGVRSRVSGAMTNLRPRAPWYYAPAQIVARKSWDEGKLEALQPVPGRLSRAVCPEESIYRTFYKKLSVARLA